MKFSPIAGLLAAALVLAGCEQATTQKDSGSGPETKGLTVVNTATTFKYYNLSTGEEVADAVTQDWDVAFSSSSGGVRTNSGKTASDLSSGGLGGVYYTGSTDFANVTSYNVDGFGGDYATDVGKYVAQNQSQDGGEVYTAPTTPTTLNIMTKLDYVDGTDGTESNYFKNKADAAAYDGDAYYTYADGVTSASEEVYIIRHGDGASYSKFQITTMTLVNGERTRVIKYANF